MTEITEITRRAIVDYIVAAGVAWSGRLQEDEFLARLYDLSAMPSTDRRVRGADADIRQHRINWHDWSDDWVFYDSRFNLLRGPDETFVAFLCEVVHPIVRLDSAEARALGRAFNEELAADGWELAETGQISGRPIFEGRRIDRRAVVFPEPTGWQKLDRQVQEVRSRLDIADSEEEYQAVGLLCREVLITAAQQVFSPELHPLTDDVQPSETDARRLLEAIFNAELAGSANEDARSHAKAALRLALALQHKRTADFRMAALCAEGTFSVVNMLAVLAGRRQQQSKPTSGAA
jgi:hypothetical protein